MPDTKLPDINRNYKPTDKEQDLRKWVYFRKRDMEQAPERQRAEKVWDKGEKQWDQYRKEKDEWDWQADYYVPMTTSVVESILSEMVENLPQPLIIPRGPEDASKARVMQAIFEYTWDQAYGDDEMMKIMRGGLIHGTAIAQEYYLQDQRVVRDIVGLSEKANKRKQREIMGNERTVLEFDGCMLEWVSPNDIYIDEKAHEFNRGVYKSRDVIRRYVMNYRDAKEFFEGTHWDHLNNFRFVKPGGDTDYYQFYKPPQGIDHSEEVEVLWYWSRTPEDLLVITINDVVVRMGPNPFKHKQIPFAKAIDIERIGKFYGKGEPELLDSIQDEVNRMRRMTIDRHHLDIDKTFVVGQNTMLDEEDLIARPHGMIPVDDPQNVRPVEYGDIPLSVERTFRAINEDKIGVTGVDDRFQSVQKAPSTATEAAILKESTLKRIRMKLANYEKRFLSDVGRMRLSNILQFYTQPRLEKIVGEKGTQEYQRQVARLSAQGLLTINDGQPMRKTFRRITTEGKKLEFDERGEVQQKKEPGFHFFEARPEYFVPMYDEGFDIRFEAGPSLPVSKPLMQQKMQEAFDRVIGLAQEGLTNYDPEKLADELIIRPADLNPEDLKRQEALQEQSVEENRLALAIDLASQENEMVLTGQPIPELGTPYAPPAHTEVHIAFLRSDQMKNAPQEIYDALLQHTVGEMEAIKARGGEGGQPAAMGGGGQMPTTTPGAEARAAVPGLIQGGAEVPTGRVLGNG